MDNANARPRGRTLTDRQARAIAHHLVDVIETRALELMAADPALDKPAAFAAVIARMAKA